MEREERVFHDDAPGPAWEEVWPGSGPGLSRGPVEWDGGPGSGARAPGEPPETSPGPTDRRPPGEGVHDEIRSILKRLDELDRKG